MNPTQRIRKEKTSRNFERFNMIETVLENELFPGNNESDRLLAVGFYGATVLDRCNPGRTLSDNFYRLFFHTITVVAQRFYITDSTFPVHDKLYPYGISSFRSTVVNRSVRVQISFKVFSPRCF